MYSSIYHSITHSRQDMETTKMPLRDKWIKKRWYVSAMEYYSGMRKEDILPSATTLMDIEHIMLSEGSQRRTNTV